jgi:hypothetical protein
MEKLYFLYIIIFIVILAIFNKLVVGLNIILGLAICYIVIKYLFNKKEKDDKIENDLTEIKKSIIKPIPKVLFEYNDIINLLFSIQDFYKYNPPAYEELVDSLDDFFYLYDEVRKLNNLAGINYKLMETKKQDSINSLQSLIYQLPSSKQYNTKLNLSIETLDKMLSKYLHRIYEINKNNIITNGYNIDTIIINKNEPKPYQLYKLEYGNNYDFF